MHSGFKARSIFMKCVFNRCFILAPARAWHHRELPEQPGEHGGGAQDPVFVHGERHHVGEIQIFLEESVDGLGSTTLDKTGESRAGEDSQPRRRHGTSPSPSGGHAQDHRGLREQLGALREMSAVIGATKNRP